MAKLNLLYTMAIHSLKNSFTMRIPMLIDDHAIHDHFHWQIPIGTSLWLAMLCSANE
jgi:hypothetical protein